MNLFARNVESLTPTDSFRMARLQVFNWGTFDGLHDIPISEKGFLFVGRSGSGKTTLLDAISALMIPPRWIDFNAAAREATRRGSDRNWVSYVRGAFKEQREDDSGEIVTRYLRQRGTWSAIALTYRNSRGRVVVLVELFWIRSSSTKIGDVKRHYAIFEREFELEELKGFDLNVRRLKQSHADGVFFENFEPYRERFGRLLGIEKEMALRLLHKTQSAKNLGDLNSFLRDFMLDPPATFEAADRLVKEFAELNEAHQAVVTARQQVQLLKPAQRDFDRFQSVSVEVEALADLLQGIDPYREALRCKLLEKRLEELRVELEALQGKRDQQQARMDNQQAALLTLGDRHSELGGANIERLEVERTQVEKSRNDRLGKRAQLQESCKRLDVPLPTSPEAFAQLVGKARNQLEQRQEQGQLAKAERDKKVLQQSEMQKQLREIVDEVESMQRQPSNIPRHMLTLRHQLATSLGLSDEVLPFVGELIEVTDEHAAWRGAIERLLHGFALSILVQERHYASLATLVNEQHLGNRLTYYRTDRPSSAGGKSASLNSVVRKLQIQSGNNHDWLAAELRNRFDYACVDSLKAFRETERCLTREGQIRHGRNHHVKDDRRRIDDRASWVLGFDNRDKLSLFKDQGHELAEKLALLDRDIRTIDQSDEERSKRVLHCNTIVNLRWEEIDVAPLVERLSTIQREIDAIHAGNKSLKTVAKEIEEERKRFATAEKSLRQIDADVLRTQDKQKDALELHRKTVKSLAETPLLPSRAEALESRFAALPQAATLDNLADHSRQVERALNSEKEKLIDERSGLEKRIERAFAEFKSTWAAEASDLDATLASAPDFFGKLKRLEIDGLPQYEHRFFDLLKEQSNQNLASLNSQLRQARNEILERMDAVNEGLKKADFNPGTYLNIDVSDRLLPEVRDFRREVQDALSHAWTEDRDLAERRFEVLKRIVGRLTSEDPDERRWRDAVLDVRQHVEFIARELGIDGTEIEVYRSGAGKSGGQRQKLATTCLAAALKYQLGGSDQDAPQYAPVVLDEAFDKADHEYTKMSMDIFRKLGFQMIVATPLKSVMTLEPFIGGACFVEINDRQKSGVLLIEYDEQAMRLDLPENTRAEPHLEVS